MGRLASSTSPNASAVPGALAVFLRRMSHTSSTHFDPITWLRANLECSQVFRAYPAYTGIPIEGFEGGQLQLASLIVIAPGQTILIDARRRELARLCG